MGHWGYIGLAYGLAAITLVAYRWSLAVRIRKRRARLDREVTERIEVVA
ncbi:MAG: hypothetical protein ACE5K9_08525 [Candidatus Methylomirabilales bacterium]